MGCLSLEWCKQKDEGGLFPRWSGWHDRAGKERRLEKKRGRHDRLCCQLCGDREDAACMIERWT